MQGRAVAEVRNPQHKHEEMTHGPLQQLHESQTMATNMSKPCSALLVLAVFAAFFYLQRFCICSAFVVKLMKMFF